MLRKRRANFFRSCLAELRYQISSFKHEKNNFASLRDISNFHFWFQNFSGSLRWHLNFNRGFSSLIGAELEFPKPKFANLELQNPILWFKVRFLSDNRVDYFMLYIENVKLFTLKLYFIIQDFSFLAINMIFNSRAGGLKTISSLAKILSKADFQIFKN